MLDESPYIGDLMLAIPIGTLVRRTETGWSVSFTCGSEHGIMLHMEGKDSLMRLLYRVEARINGISSNS